MYYMRRENRLFLLYTSVMLHIEHLKSDFTQNQKHETPRVERQGVSIVKNRKNFLD